MGLEKAFDIDGSGAIDSTLETAFAMGTGGVIMACIIGLGALVARLPRDPRSPSQEVKRQFGH